MIQKYLLFSLDNDARILSTWNVLGDPRGHVRRPLNNPFANGKKHTRTHGQKAQEIISKRPLRTTQRATALWDPSTRPAACLVSSPPLPRRPPDRTSSSSSSSPPTIRASRSFSPHFTPRSRLSRARRPFAGRSHGRPPGRRGGRLTAHSRAGGRRSEPRRRRARALGSLPLRLLRLQRRPEPPELRQHRTRRFSLSRSALADSSIPPVPVLLVLISDPRGGSWWCRRATWAPSRWGFCTPPSRSFPWSRRPWSPV